MRVFKLKTVILSECFGCCPMTPTPYTGAELRSLACTLTNNTVGFTSCFFLEKEKNDYLIFLKIREISNRFLNFGF